MTSTQIITFKKKQLSIEVASLYPLIFFDNLKDDGNYPAKYLSPIKIEIKSIHKILSFINSAECQYTTMEKESFNRKARHRQLRSEVLEHTYRVLYPKDVRKNPKEGAVYSFFKRIESRRFKDDAELEDVLEEDLKSLDYRTTYRVFSKILMQFTSRTRLFYYEDALQKGYRFNDEELVLQNEIDLLEKDRKALVTMYKDPEVIELARPSDTGKKSNKKLTRKEKIAFQKSSAPIIQKLVDQTEKERARLNKELNNKLSLSFTVSMTK